MEYQICKKCVLDSTVPYISFDDRGVCSFCHFYREVEKYTVGRDKKVKDQEFKKLINDIKKTGKRSKYDCILGVSGGVDSTYLALLTKELGLRPLVVHFDNGWNSELAVKNIENIVSKLGYDLYTYVMDWEEFRDIQIAYFKASVIDIEVPNDQFIFAALNIIAKKQKIKYILSGHNVVTELITPDGWSFKRKFDLVNLKNIHKKFGKLNLKKLPKFGVFNQYYYQEICGIQTVSFLNYVDYNKPKVKEIIKDKLSWRDYGGKHYESIFTKFYQGYILPKKFNADKRKAHLSNLIMSGQISRDEALEELAQPTYPLGEQLKDKEYVIKKWGMDEEEFDKIMNLKPIPHEHYGTEHNFLHRLLYFIVRKSLYFPIRILRVFGILYTPKKYKQ